ncbi:programmed cell death protein 5-like [Crassostrea angulata]|uniref:Programmed cell death protein 5 n=2 Tax=Magallana gigas TaxID=29159 RepID=A0A8W8KPS2_MAGGI|nr:programmed cell death protein 5-like [Crassostrea gigas]XP_034339152.1 programmed cell death protein 5 [Crassostrea gigas]XP_052716730.1 programmed cell death protein 5-like [Crassostrea angulata]|eukprot:XP_011423739.1 PREDICTED: programmed cell death protein 5-like [Crassostrea gigas]
MADDELEALRAQRMAQLQSQYGGGGAGRPSQEEQEEKARQMTEMKNSILSQVLDQQARARLNTIAVAKPEKAKMVENMLCQMAQSGQIQNKIGEQQLKSLLERVSEQTAKKTTVKFKRRGLDDSDED